MAAYSTRGPANAAPAPARQSCARRINLAPAPRTPRLQELRCSWGKPGGEGASRIAFRNPGIRGELQKPVDRPLMQAPHPHSTKANGRFATFEIPQVGRFHPRVCLISPHVDFLRRAACFPVFSSSSEEREKRERRTCASRPSTGSDTCLKISPRVSGPIHGFSVDTCGTKDQCRQGVTCAPPCIHGSTREMPVYPPEEAEIGDAHA